MVASAPKGVNWSHLWLLGGSVAGVPGTGSSGLDAIPPPLPAHSAGGREPGRGGGAAANTQGFTGGHEVERHRAMWSCPPGWMVAPCFCSLKASVQIRGRSRSGQGYLQQGAVRQAEEDTLLHSQV